MPRFVSMFSLDCGNPVCDEKKPLLRQSAEWFHRWVLCESSLWSVSHHPPFASAFQSLSQVPKPCVMTEKTIGGNLLFLQSFWLMFKKKVMYYNYKKNKTYITITRQVTHAPRVSLSRNAIMNFQTGKRYKTIRHCWFLHTLYKRIGYVRLGYVIIPKPHFQGVNV